MPTESPHQAEASGCLSSQHREEAHEAAGELLDAASVDQRRDWLEGKRIPIAARLRRYPALAADAGLAAALVFHEFLLRQEMNDSPDWEDYLHRFPEYAVSLCRLREIDQLVEEELAPDNPTACPQTLVGEYEILGELGRGGMGVVYKARQVKLDRLVALKMIRTGEYSSEEERRRFDDEARAVACLQHPHIVRIHDVGEADGRPFFAMEYVAGPSLARRFDGTPWEVRPAAALVEVLARAMHYAHGKGIVHRDLKPANVLFDEHDQPLVTDFGLAKRLDGHSAGTQTGTAMGTPSYMAPEQVQGQSRRISPATDVYALGAILYELLTGRPPFKAATAVETAVQVIDAEPVRPGRLRPGLPRDLETVCLKCLEKDPRKRFASAEELADDLRRFLEGKPVRARPVGVVGRGWRWCRRRPAVAALLLGLALVLVSGFALFAALFGQTVEAWSREEAARRKAEDRDRRTRQILAALVRLNRQMPHQTPEVRRNLSLEQLKKSADDLEELLHENPTDVALQATLADAYEGLSFLEVENWHLTAAVAVSEKSVGLSIWMGEALASGSDYQIRTVTAGILSIIPQQAHNHRQIANALAYVERTLELLKRVVEAHPRSPEYRVRLAEVYHWKALLHRHTDNLPQALTAFEHACSIRQALSDEQPAPDRRYHLAVAKQLQAESLHTLGRTGEAYQCVETGLELARRLLAEQPGEKKYRNYLAQTYGWLASIHESGGAHKESLRCWQRAYDLWKEWLQQRPGDAEARRVIAPIAIRLIRNDAIEPYYTEAVGPYQAACTSIARLAEDQPDNLWLRRLLEWHYRDLGLCHEKAGQPARRVAAWSQYAHLLEILAERLPGDEGLGLDSAKAHGDLADVYQAAGDARNAVRAAERGIAILQARRPVGTPSAGDAERRFQWADRAWNVAHTIRRGGLPDKALVLAEQSRLIFLELIRESPRDLRYGIGLLKACEAVGRAYVRLGRPDEALAAYLSSVEAVRRVIELEPANLNYRQLLAGRCLNLNRHLRDLGRFSEAADWLLEREKLLPADEPNLRLVSQEFALLAVEVGKDSPELTPAELAERQHYLRLSARPASEVAAWVPPSAATAPTRTGR